jgi:hypothetical protein
VLAAFGGDALCEHSSRQATRLEDEDFSGSGEMIIQNELGNLRGFSGPGGGLQDDSGMRGKGFAESVAEFVDGE